MNRLILILTAIGISATGYAMTMQEALDKALGNNFQLLAAEHKSQSAKYRVETAKTPYLPQLDAKYAYQTSSENAYGTEDEIATFSLSLGYNLFNGFSDLYNLKAAKSAYQAQKHDTEAVKQDIVLAVKKAYINVLAALDGITVTENAVALLENQLKDIKLSYDVGYVAKNEVLKIEAELASSRQNVLSAKSGYKLAVYNLEKLTGADIPLDEKFEGLTGTTASAGEFDALKDKMMKNRSELKYLDELINAKQYGIKSNSGGYYPKVSLGAAYSSYGEDMNPSDRTYTYDSETVLSLSVSMNLFDGLNKYNNGKSLQADKLNLIYTLRDTKAGMLLQLKNAVENLTLANASLETAEKELLSAKENYRITQNQFKQKVATNTDLMDARVMLTRAENNYNNARFNIHRALADIARITESDSI
jgi:outer membrane protein TolC